MNALVVVEFLIFLFFFRGRNEQFMNFVAS